jgi:hypothetical protein
VNGATRINTFRTALGAVVLLLVGCDSKDESHDASSVRTPPPSATIGPSGSGAATGGSPSVTASSKTSGDCALGQSLDRLEHAANQQSAGFGQPTGRPVRDPGG